MNLLVAALFAAAAPASVPDHDAYHDRVITAASQLVSWCRAEAEARVIADGGTPYQWRSSYRERVNTLEVDAILRVDGEDVTVQCRIARGARARYASIAFVGR